MSRSLLAVPVLLMLLGVQTPAQQFPPGFVDPAPLLAAAAKEIGEANFKCVTFSGAGYSGAVGQTFEYAQSTSTGRGSTRWPTTRGRSTGKPARARKRSIASPA